MKPEQSEQLLIEELFLKSCGKLNISCKIENVEKLTGDASTRRYYRLFTDVETYVVCLDNPTEIGNNSFVNVQKFLTNKGVRVPRIFDSKEKKGFILEEDLGNVTLLNYLATIESRENELSVYTKILDELLKVHSIDKNAINKNGSITETFDMEKFNFELNFTLKYFLKLFLEVDDETLEKKIYDEFQKIHHNLTQDNMVLTHRDFHSRNIMVKKDEFIVIDFQDARWGLPQYDLVSLLEDCYYELDDQTREELKVYYFERLKSIINDQSDFQKFSKLYDEMAIQRVFKAIGSFSYIYNKRKDIRYLKYIGFAMEKLKRIFLRNPEYNELRKLIYKHYYES